MNRTDQLRAIYEDLRDDDGEFWPAIGAAVDGELDKLAEGQLVKKFFHGRPSVLDVLFLAGAWEKEVKFAVADKIAEALESGHSWNQVAAALGISRQAAVKRFREWTGNSAYQLALINGHPAPRRDPSERLPTALEP
jgi:AraC-like DNA-binding protein